MVTDLERGQKKLDDNYEITYSVLKSDVSLPFKIVILVHILVGILTNSALVYYLINYRYSLHLDMQSAMIMSLISGIIIFLLGLIGGRIWISFGYRLARATYRVYLKEGKSIFQRIFSFFYLKFSEPDAQVYLEAKAKDPRLKNPISLLKLIMRISISELSFFIISTSFFARPVVLYIKSILPSTNFLNQSYTNVQIAQVVIALAMAVIFMALYMPMNFIMNDANIRTWKIDDRKISTPSKTIRSRIDNVIGLGALISGWNLYLQDIISSGHLFILDNYKNLLVYSGFNFIEILDYIAWILFLLILSWPLIIPAGIYYFLHHGRTVNKYRAEASKHGVPVAVSLIRLPTMEEENIIKEFEEKVELSAKRKKKDSKKENANIFPNMHNNEDTLNEMNIDSENLKNNNENSN